MYGPPNKRTKYDHHLLTSHMRERKAQRAARRAREQNANVMQESLSAIHDQGLLRKGRKIELRMIKANSSSKKVLTLVVRGAGKKPKCLTIPTILDMAFSVSSASDVARVFAVHRYSVVRIRNLVASVAILRVNIFSESAISRIKFYSEPVILRVRICYFNGQNLFRI